MIASEAAEAKIGIIFSWKRNSIDSSGGWSGNRCAGSSTCAWTWWAVTVAATEGAETYIISRSSPADTNIGDAGRHRTACRRCLDITAKRGIRSRGDDNSIRDNAN